MVFWKISKKNPHKFGKSGEDQSEFLASFGLDCNKRHEISNFVRFINYEKLSNSTGQKIEKNKKWNKK